MSESLKIGVTGANGFIGLNLCPFLEKKGYRIKRFSRSDFSNNQLSINIQSIDESTNWDGHLEGLDTIVHLAAKVHNLAKGRNLLEQYRQTNVKGTLHLAKQAFEQGARRFIFLSSIKVNGNSTFGAPFTAFDHPAPEDTYAISKLEAEQGLIELANKTGLEIVIIRPPLIYGPHVKANFLRLMKLAHKTLPLPLGGIKNKRSLLFIDNLNDCLEKCFRSESATGRILLLSDEEDISTPELIKSLQYHMGKSSMMLLVPEPILRNSAKLIGKSEDIDRLCGSMQVDISETTKILDWHPPVTMSEGLRVTCEWFMKHV